MAHSTSGTVLITGASSGIGEAFAHALAQRGHDLILVARRKEKLDTVAEAIRTSTGQEVTVITADLSTEGGIAKIEGAIAASGDLAMLVNNAGFGTTGPLIDVEPDKQEAMVRLHVDATYRLTRAALPGMVKARRGSVINVSSISAYMPAPNRTLYGGTKAFINYFSRALQFELAGTGVKVQAIAPGFTYSGFHDTEEFRNWSRSQIPKALWMSAEEVVSISLEKLGKKVIVVAGWKNRALTILGSNPLTSGLLGWVMQRRFATKKGG